ncbi:DUF1641 domain-containing protein [Sporosarcina limicola]|uniref:Uncharacterized protein YjgD (DUF1641 family) n=1 Tax=Sporosarcina limicola TaxID=34101 RepID=A0A927ML22_9BACL|nr:DUF1641 domain-containing protein [Sporosarcina limicola]MBE1556685.1 uncharacterized protein YjgD (DUF1641 family) [Sporosarcina limicola]
MATPITSIKEKERTPEEVQKERILELQSLIAEQEQSLNKILGITGELNNAGVLDAVAAMVKAKEDIAGIAVHQASREPITNLINNVMNATGVLTAIDPAVTAKLAASVQSGLHEAELYRGNNDKVSLLGLMKSLNDPDINRAIKFGLDFLKGMGKELDGE